MKEFKAVSGHNKYLGSLEGVTAIEKEKFPKNFWPDVSVCVVAVFFFFISIHFRIPCVTQFCFEYIIRVYFARTCIA